MPLDHYVTLGRSGLRVSPFALGAMTFGEDPGAAGCSVEESEKILRTYLDRGGNFIDTANFYTNGHSEKILGDFFAASSHDRERRGARVEVLLQHVPRRPQRRRGRTRGHPQAARRDARRMRTDYLDLYWMHNWDRNTPIEETLKTLDELVGSGKIRYVGFSNTPAWVTAQAQTSAQLKGWTPLIALQVEYSLLARTVEGEVAPMARDFGMALVPWSPLKNGFLSGKYRRNVQVSDSERAKFVGGPTAREFAVIDVVTEVAQETGASEAAVSLAWLRQRENTVVPIIGARRLEHLESNLEEVTLTTQQLAKLDEASKPELNYPAPLHGELRAMLQFAGTTVDGEASNVYPPLLQSTVRY